MARSPKSFTPRAPRSEIRLRAKLFFDGRECEGDLLNVSLSGGFLRLQDPPESRTVFALAIQPPRGEPILFHGRVMRYEKLDDGQGCAVQFLNLSPESEGRLAFLLKKKAR